MVRAAIAVSIFLAVYAAYLATPAKYTLVLATFEEDSESDITAEEAFRESRNLPAELLQKLQSPIFVADTKGEVIAMLLHGSLDDWAQNPQYVLEVVTRRTAHMRFVTFKDRCCGLGSIGEPLRRLTAAVARDVDKVFGRSWAAKLQVSPNQDPKSCEDWPYWRRRLHCGKVLESNVGWQHVAIHEAAPEGPGDTVPEGQFQRLRPIYPVLEK